MRSIAHGLKKALCITLAAATAFSLASCSSPEPGSADAGNGSPSTTLNWYLYLDSIQPDQAKVVDKLNEYLEQKINAKVDLHTFDIGTYSTKMPVIISSGQNYDICFAATWGTVNYVQTATTGAFLKLDRDLLEKNAPETLKAIPENVWDSSKVQGTVYGIPNYKEMGSQHGNMVNMDIAKKYGIDLSKIESEKYKGSNWKEIMQNWEDVYRQLHAKAPDIIALDPNYMWGTVNFALNTSSCLGQIVYPGCSPFPNIKENTVFNPYETDVFKEYCDTIHRWFKAGYLPPNPQTYSEDTRNADDKAGRVFSWGIGYAPGYDAVYSQNVGHTEKFFPLSPVLFEGASNFQCVSAKSKHPDEALKFLNLVNTDKTVGNLLRHGIEGTHYKLTNGQVEPTGKAYGYDMGWQFGSVFNQDWVTSYPKNVAQIYSEYNESALQNPLLGYTFDDSNYKNQIAALTSVIKQYSDSLVLGTVDRKETLPTFLKALKDNGVDDLLQEEQKQVDEFLSKSK